MKTYNLEEGMPSVLDAGKYLSKLIRESKNKEKVIKVIHGYGSTGTGGAIKRAVHKSLRKRVNTKEIAAYIPGEAISTMMGFDECISKYKQLIQSDSDYRKGNDGITYIIL